MQTPIPVKFIEELTTNIGTPQAQRLAEALDDPSSTAIRLNPRKHTLLPPLNTEMVSWCEQGRVLDSRPQFTLMPQWHAGCFYVQEPASMIITEVVKRLVNIFGQRDIRYLDMCAAPGGKTTGALSVLPDEAFVVANEYVSSRANILAENLAKWGYTNVAVTCGDTAAFRKLPSSFDIVAVDAPCSGEGMMRKDEEARRQWSPELVQQCAALQHEIILNAWQTLRPGGYLIYSTCTFNRTENEEMLRYAVDELRAESVDLGLASDFRLPGSLDPALHALRFMPHLTLGEGLFMAVLRKPLGEAESPKKAKEKVRNSVTTPERIYGLLSNPADYNYDSPKEGLWRAIPKTHSHLVSLLTQHTRLLTAGIALGEIKGKDFVPDPALALSTAFSPSAYPRVEVDLQTALQYLRREALILPTDTPKGFVVITYNGHPLGFVKNLGKRANNLYPQNWRIRHL